MRIKMLRSWSGFKKTVVEPFLRSLVEKSDVFWFRGQNDARFPLCCTLDRHQKYKTDTERETRNGQLLAAFREEITSWPTFRPIKDIALELLARHHGLPSPLLDWSESPYVAAYFAFARATNQKTEKACVWVLNRARLLETKFVTIIQDKELLWYNERALEQRGVFLRINSATKQV